MYTMMAMEEKPTESNFSFIQLSIAAQVMYFVSDEDGDVKDLELNNLLRRAVDCGLFHSKQALQEAVLENGAHTYENNQFYLDELKDNMKSGKFDRLWKSAFPEKPSAKPAPAAS